MTRRDKTSEGNRPFIFQNESETIIHSILKYQSEISETFYFFIVQNRNVYNEKLHKYYMEKPIRECDTSKKCNRIGCDPELALNAIERQKALFLLSHS